MKRRVIIDLVTEVEENEPPTLLYDDIRQELLCCWHDVSFTMRGEDVTEPQTERKCIDCKFLTYMFGKTWCNIKCDNPHDKVCDRWAERNER